MSVGSIANPDRAIARDVTSAVPTWICLIYNIISFMFKKKTSENFKVLGRYQERDRGPKGTDRTFRLSRRRMRMSSSATELTRADNQHSPTDLGGDVALQLCLDSAL
jgi:hypothetical protein